MDILKSLFGIKMDLCGIFFVEKWIILEWDFGESEIKEGWAAIKDYFHFSIEEYHSGVIKLLLEW